jgi:hypothetical protein
MPIKSGTLVKVAPELAQQLRRYGADRRQRGKVINRAKRTAGCWRVKWDDIATVEVIAEDYLIPLRQERRAREL